MDHYFNYVMFQKYFLIKSTENVSLLSYIKPLNISLHHEWHCQQLWFQYRPTTSFTLKCFPDSKASSPESSLQNRSLVTTGEMVTVFKLANKVAVFIEKPKIWEKRAMRGVFERFQRYFVTVAEREWEFTHVTAGV